MPPPPIPIPLDVPAEPPDAAAAAANADTGRMEWEEVMVPSGRRNDISAERPARPKTVEARDDDDDDERRRFIFVIVLEQAGSIDTAQTLNY